MFENAMQDIKEMLAKLTGLEAAEIGDNDDLFKDLGIDSLKVIEIATQLEKTYKIVVKDSQLKNIRTVQDAARFLDELLVRKNA